VTRSNGVLLLFLRGIGSHGMIINGTEEQKQDYLPKPPLEKSKC